MCSHIFSSRDLLKSWTRSILFCHLFCFFFGSLKVLNSCTTNELKYVNKFVYVTHCKYLQKDFGKQANDKEARIWSDKDSRNLWKEVLTFFVMTLYRWYQSRGENDRQSDNLPNTFIVTGLKTEIESQKKSWKHATFETICVHLAAKSVWIGAKTDKWYLEPVVRVIWYTSPDHQLFILRPLIGVDK